MHDCMQFHASIQALHEASQALIHNIQRQMTAEDIRLLLEVNQALAHLVTKQQESKRRMKHT